MTQFHEGQYVEVAIADRTNFGAWIKAKVTGVATDPTIYQVRLPGGRLVLITPERIRAVEYSKASSAMVRPMTPDYKEFAIEVISVTLDGGSWDGGDIQELAEKYGILKSVPYDPETHGPNDVDAEPGGTWFVFVGDEIAP